MKYQKLSETSAFIETDKIFFRIDANEVNFDSLGFEASEQMRLDEQERANAHAFLLTEFEDESKLAVFVSMLEQDPNTGYSKYIATHFNG